MSRNPIPKPIEVALRLETVYFKDGWSIWPIRNHDGRMMWHVHRRVRRGSQPEEKYADAIHYTYKAALNSVAHWMEQRRWTNAYAKAVFKAVRRSERAKAKEKS